MLFRSKCTQSCNRAGINDELNNVIVNKDSTINTLQDSITVLNTTIKVYEEKVSGLSQSLTIQSEAAKRISEVKKNISNKPKQSRIGHVRVDELNVDDVREFYYREGETQKTTAKHFNVGYNAMAQFMKDNGINSKPGGNQKLATQMAAEKKRKETAKKMEDATKHLDENEVFNLIAKQGMTYKEVADHFGIDKRMLHRYCEEHNIYNPSYIKK